MILFADLLWNTIPRITTAMNVSLIFKIPQPQVKTGEKQQIQTRLIGRFVFSCAFPLRQLSASVDRCCAMCENRGNCSNKVTFSQYGFAQGFAFSPIQRWLLVTLQFAFTVNVTHKCLELLHELYPPRI